MNVVRALFFGFLPLVPFACSENGSSLPRGQEEFDEDAKGGGGDSGTSGNDGSSSGEDSATKAESSVGDGSVPDWVGPDGGVSSKMTFFVTSKGAGKGGDFRKNAGDADGLAGADAFCTSLATAVSPILGAKTWRAYLGAGATTPRSRIGDGPFINSKGDLVAKNAAQLHDEGIMNSLSQSTNLDEWGVQVPIAGPNQHDILTGATAAGANGASNCSNWTSSATGATGIVGHANRAGGGAAPTSWNAAHATQGCAESGANSVRSGGGRGSIYCIAVP